MTLSPDEQRDLGEISRSLSRDEELRAVADLFAGPPQVHIGAQPVPRHRGGGAIVAVLAAVVAFATGCVVAAMTGPGPIAVGTLLVLCSAALLVAVLVRSRTGTGH
ncbi:MAG TPA: hypothetical protein VFX16_19880 [Pseudonocardiaceae bacterium]|nr:hypothetical protein [Pseudonocardiaceae bacterium]